MTAHMTRVTLNGLLDDHVLVTKGLKEGDKVVSAGAPYLRDGVKVNIVTDLAIRNAKPEARP